MSMSMASLPRSRVKSINALKVHDDSIRLASKDARCLFTRGKEKGRG